jgi:predicted RNA-binding Zn-ribbon protein involved in translation (DUF1610 family)
MISFSCSSCDNKLSAPEERIGSKVRCPGCQGVMVVPESGGGIAERPREPDHRAPLVEADDPNRGRDRDRPRRYEADDDRPRRGRDDRDDRDDRPRRGRDDRDDRPGRRRNDDEDNPFRRRRSSGDVADCPQCGANEATRVHWTWWGGLIGPMIINTVRCRDCGTAYNGKHGDYNTTRIALYLLIPLGIVFVMCLLGAVSSAFR